MCRAMKATTEAWIALEDEEEEDDDNEEDTMKELFGVEGADEEEEETDVESNGEAATEIFELF